MCIPEAGSVLTGELRLPYGFGMLKRPRLTGMPKADDGAAASKSVKQKQVCLSLHRLQLIWLRAPMLLPASDAQTSDDKLSLWLCEDFGKLV